MRDSIFSLLTSLRGLDPLKRLFWSELNYDRVNQTLPNREWTDAERTSLADAPIIIAEHGDFKIIYDNASLVL